MKVCEEFLTLQGEGRYTGVPTYFVRTTGCNLRCAWKNLDGTITQCDTPYTSWKPESGKERTAKDILDAVSQYPYCNHVVITGGEPTLQPDLTGVVSMLTDNGYLVTIETNGTKFLDLPGALVSISPKLKSSYAQPVGSVERKMHEKNNDWKTTVKLLIQRHDYQLKFVYNTKKDVEEILNFIEMLDIPHNRVYLMPQGITTGQFSEKAQEMFKVCMEYGFNYSPRLHIDVWGNIRNR